jgi:hypothetical protein
MNAQNNRRSLLNFQAAYSLALVHSMWCMASKQRMGWNDWAEMVGSSPCMDGCSCMLLQSAVQSRQRKQGTSGSMLRRQIMGFSFIVFSWASWAGGDGAVMHRWELISPRFGTCHTTSRSTSDLTTW